MQKRTTPSAEGFSSSFEWQFLHPRYWLVWIGVGLLIIFSLFPAKWVDPILMRIGKYLGRMTKSPRKRARTNLLYSFPELSEDEREEIIDKMFEIVLPVTVLFVRTIRKKGHDKCVVWHDNGYLEKAKAENLRVIFMVPHAWAIDVPGMLLAASGYKITAFFHNQSNGLIDWLWNKTRKHFGGRLHARDDGIKPFIQSVREGYWGYYLPDEDHGAEQSLFVDFFGTYKATLPLLGRLEKVCQAEIVPLFPVYDVKTSTLHIHFRPVLRGLGSQSEEVIARRMNEEIEAFVRPNPEQYTWVLRLLKTRKEGDESPYSRDDI